jgi:ribosomal protein S18 acetylase RimI-like enzyme
VIRPLADPDLPWAEKLVAGAFASRIQARLGELVDVLDLPGFVVERDGQPAGLLTYRRDEGGCELATIIVRNEHRGAGTELLQALVAQVGPGVRIWLVTTNDNLDALRFYQRRGFRLAEVRPGAVDEARRTLKPGIPEAGAYGIPIRDELVLERPAELP